MSSLTIWSRLEPRNREFTMERALQAQVRDPLWMLTRQWQTGEFLGDDAGSPVAATVRTESVPLTSFRPGLPAAGAPVQALDAAPPLEVHVEREAAPPGLRASIALGLRFEALWTEEGGSASDLAAFQAEYPVPAVAPAGEVEDADSGRWRALAAGRALDGAALAAAAVGVADLQTVPPIPSFASGATRTAAAAALERLRDHAAALVSEPEGDSSWSPERLEHDFSVGSESATGSLQLAAPRFGGGHLDWYSFSAVAGALGTPGSTPAQVEQRSFIPNGISFRGMPNSRWWDFEDGAVNFGELDVEHVDLAKLVTMEFALISGDDWFQLPLSVPAGTLTHVETLIVSDCFGERTILAPSGEQVEAGAQPWRMFALSGIDPARDLLLVPPVLGDVLDGPELEQVLFVRDEMAAMGWAIERTLFGSLDRPVDGYARWQERLAADPPPPARTRGPDEPPVEYLAGTEVPDNWIPMVPVPESASTFRFRRGVMGGPTPTPARGRVLEPERNRYYVEDNAIPREGVRVDRRFRRTRWADGSTWVWLARRASIGRGEAGSGLEFDAVREVPPEQP